MSRNRNYPNRLSGPIASMRGGTLIGICIGMVFGIVVVAIVIWYLKKMPMPFMAPPPPPTPTQLAGAEPAALPGKPGDAPLDGKPVDPSATGDGDKPRFDFYKMLPGEAGTPSPDGKPATPDGKPVQQTAADGKPVQQTAPPADRLATPSMLQTGSFQDVSEADNQKAKLAMLGVEAQVQQVMLKDKVWYRVRLGPFHTQGDVDKMRTELARNGIEAVMVK